MRFFSPLRIVLVAVVAAVVAGGAYAFTAANTVPATNAGSGSGTVSGYTVSTPATAREQRMRRRPRPRCCLRRSTRPRRGRCRAA